VPLTGMLKEAVLPAGCCLPDRDGEGNVKKAYLASVPAGRMGTPGDIAHTVSFLASEGAGFITGQRIVDGGRSLGN
jgi:3-oxoacyl-[acyl-carrier protein] reductase